MYIFLILITFCILLIYVFMRQEKFGKLPGKERLKRIQESPHFKNGKFKNLSHTPDLTEGTTYWSVLYAFFFEPKVKNKPIDSIPSVKTDLRSLDRNRDVLIWFGHSSYFMQIDGKRILVDPVLSGSASPLPNGTKAFKGSDIYKSDDIPDIDYLFITHDHWDHLDYETIKAIRPKVQTIICGLGTGEHFEYWGYEKSRIIEKDWNEFHDLNEGFSIQTVPARHFSGRGLRRNTSLWLSFVLTTPNMKIFIGGDSGYDTHFKTTGEMHGPFDLAILENGQYDKKWRYIHMLPEELAMASKDINAKKILPVHSSKFRLSNHPWDQPLELIFQRGSIENIPIITPRIGEPVELKNAFQVFTPWWRGVK